jgi:predicted dehydrogenase
MPINVSIVGLGKIGAQYDLKNRSQKLTHASAIQGDSRFRLTSGCDNNIESRNTFESTYGVPSFGTLKEMMEYSSADVIVIATETDMHLENIYETLAYDSVKLLLCEKPISRKVESLVNLKEFIKRSNKQVLINYQRRTEMPATVIRSKILTNVFGEFLGGSALYSRGYFNNASHIIDLIEWWFESKLDLARLIGKSEKNGDFDVTLALQIRNRDFLLQVVPTTSTSILEITLQFERAQLRYVSGGSAVYIDYVQANDAYKGIGSIVTSGLPMFPGESLSMASVYSDIYSKINGGNSQLTSAVDAIDLVQRMQNFISEDWSARVSN